MGETPVSDEEDEEESNVNSDGNGQSSRMPGQLPAQQEQPISKNLHKQKPQHGKKTIHFLDFI